MSVGSCCTLENLPELLNVQLAHPLEEVEAFGVCQTGTNTSGCGGPRPGLPTGTSGDKIYATVTDPAGKTVLLAQTAISWA